MQNPKYLTLAFLLLLTLVNSQIYSVPIKDSMEYDDNTEITLFQLASSVVQSINHAIQDNSWLTNILADLNNFDEDDPQTLRIMSQDLQDFFLINKIETIEGRDALEEAQKYFEDGIKASSKRNINLGLTYTAQMRANEITRLSFLEQKAPGSSKMAVNKYIQKISSQSSNNDVDEFVLYSCGNQLEQSFASIFWQLFTSDGHDNRKLRDSINDSSKKEIGVGIAGLQNPLKANSGQECPIGSIVIVIHIAKDFQCSQYICPDIPYPAKSFSDLQVDFETSQNSRWTQYWKKLQRNNAEYNVPLAGVSVMWSYIPERLGFSEPRLEGPIFAPIKNLFNGEFSWECKSFKSGNDEQKRKWFFETIWDPTPKDRNGWSIELSQIAAAERLIVDVSYIQGIANITSGHGPVAINLDNPVTPKQVSCSDVECGSLNPDFPSAESITQCLKSSESACDPLIQKNLDTYSFYQIMMVYSLINRYREDPSNFDNVYNIEFLDNDRALIKLGAKEVTLHTKKGQSFYNQALNSIKSQKPKRRFTLSYALSVSAQFRANVLSREDNSYYDDLYMNKVTFNQVLKYLNMTVADKDHTEIKIKTCNYELIQNIIQTPYLLFSQEDDYQKYLNDLNTQEFSHIGIGVAQGNFTMDKRCHPQVLVIHLSKNAECEFEGCPVKVPVPINTEHQPFWNEMFQKLIRQQNQDHFVTMELVPEIATQDNTGKQVIRIKSVMLANPGFDYDWDQGRFNWTFHSVITTGKAPIRDLQFYHQYLKPLLSGQDITVHKHIDIPYNELKDIFSFEVYCTWVNNEGVFASAIKPTRIILNKYKELQKVPPLVIKESVEEIPYYYNFKVRGFSPYPKSNIFWQRPSVPAFYDNTFTYYNYQFSTGKEIKLTAGVSYMNQTEDKRTKSIDIRIPSLGGKTPSFRQDKGSGALQWSNIIHEDIPEASAYIKLESRGLYSQFYLEWKEGLPAKSGTFILDPPFAYQQFQNDAILGLNIYPEFAMKIKPFIEKTKNPPLSLPKIDPYVQDVNKLAKQVGSMINYAYKMKRDNGGKIAKIVKVSLKEDSCLHGKPTLYEYPLAWNIQKYTCNCTEGWGGLMCDLTKTQLSDIQEQLENFFVAIDSFPQNKETIPKIYKLFEKMSLFIPMLGIYQGGIASKFIQSIENVENSKSYSYSIDDIENAMEAVINLWRTPHMLQDEKSHSFYTQSIEFIEKYIQYALDVSQFNNFDSRYIFKALRMRMAFTYVNPIVALDEREISLGYNDVNYLDYDGYTSGYRQRDEFPQDMPVFYVNPNQLVRQLTQPVAVYLELPKEIFYPFEGFGNLTTYVYYLTFYDQNTKETYEPSEYTVEIKKFKSKWYVPSEGSQKCIIMVEDFFTTDYCNTTITSKMVICTCSRPGFVSYTQDIKITSDNDPNLEFDQDDDELTLFEKTIRVIFVALLAYAMYWLIKKYNQSKKNYKYSSIESTKNKSDYVEYEMQRGKGGDFDDGEAQLKSYDQLK